MSSGADKAFAARPGMQPPAAVMERCRATPEP